MPPIYDDYIYESGFGEVMTLFSDESTILEEVPIDYDNKVAIYDDYCDDMYAIKKNDKHETCHHYFSFQLDYASHDNNCYTLGAIHTINDESDYAYDMKRPKLGDAMFEEDDVFENIFAAINVCPKLGMLCLMKMIFFVSQVLICKFVMMIACLLLMTIILMKVGLEECQL